MKGRNDDCLYALSRLRRLPSHDDRVQLEWKGIITDVKFHSEVMAKQHPGKKGLRLELLEWMDLFKPKYIKRTAVALGMPFFQQVGPCFPFPFPHPQGVSTVNKRISQVLRCERIHLLCSNAVQHARPEHQQQSHPQRNGQHFQHCRCGSHSTEHGSIWSSTISNRWCHWNGDPAYHHVRHRRQVP